jgi:hypothetical protein
MPTISAASMPSRSMMRNGTITANQARLRVAADAVRGADALLPRHPAPAGQPKPFSLEA